MVQAGASGINWIGVVAEWTPDYTSAERQAVNPGLVARGGGVALSIEYVLANITPRLSSGQRDPIGNSSSSLSLKPPTTTEPSGS